MTNNPAPIILKAENRKQLSKRLQEAQADCTDNLLEVSHLFATAKKADAMLAQTPLPKKLWNRIEVPVDPHQATAAQWRNETTVAYLARSQRNYRLTTVFRSKHQRGSDSPQQPPLYLYLSAGERDALLASFLREHRILLKPLRAARRAKPSTGTRKAQASARSAQKQPQKPSPAASRPKAPAGTAQKQNTPRVAGSRPGGRTRASNGQFKSA